MEDDAFFSAPYVDVDEARQVPLPHRYVHGGFEGTDTRFSIYLPPPEQYRNHFLHYAEGGHGGNETSLLGPMNAIGVGFPLFRLAFEELGCYLVESNRGHLGNDLSGIKGDWSICYWRAGVAAARYAKQVATEYYGSEPRYGYVQGGSGGGWSSWLSAEHAPDLYDGAVPCIISTEGTVTLSSHAYGVEGLGDALEQVIDACEVGGSGEPFVGLDTSQIDALTVLLRTGYPRRAENQLRRNPVWGFGIQALKESDPGYFDDFWTLRGYAGADNADTVTRRLVEGKATVQRVLSAENCPGAMSMLVTDPDTPYGIELDVDEPDRLFYAALTFTSGNAAGRHLYIAGTAAGVLTPYPIGFPELFKSVEPGDELTFDNRDFVAFCHYHRHVGISDVHPEMSVDGHPMYPQRPRTDSILTGRYDGKMIMVPGALDVNVFPPTAYPKWIADHHGDAVDEHFRIWWMDHAGHTPPSMMDPTWCTWLIDYRGYFEQAIRDVVAWSEDGVAPAKMSYRFTRDNGLVLPDTAEERGGIQPVVEATANGAPRAEIRLGDAVQLHGTAAVPTGMGTLVHAEWDFDGAGNWPVRCAEADGSPETIDVIVQHTFTETGTYYPCFRVGSHRHGAHGQGASVDNLARARVVVHP